MDRLRYFLFQLVVLLIFIQGCSNSGSGSFNHISIQYGPKLINDKVYFAINHRVEWLGVFSGKYIQTAIPSNKDYLFEASSNLDGSLTIKRINKTSYSDHSSSFRRLVFREKSGYTVEQIEEYEADVCKLLKEGQPIELSELSSRNIIAPEAFKCGLNRYHPYGRDNTNLISIENSRICHFDYVDALRKVNIEWPKTSEPSIKSELEIGDSIKLFADANERVFITRSGSQSYQDWGSFLPNELVRIEKCGSEVYRHTLPLNKNEYITGFHTDDGLSVRTRSKSGEGYYIERIISLNNSEVQQSIKVPKSSGILSVLDKKNSKLISIKLNNRNIADVDKISLRVSIDNVSENNIQFNVGIPALLREDSITVFSDN